MEFNITPKEITKTAVRLSVSPRNINWEAKNFIAEYKLYDADGGEVESGTKTIDIQYIDFLKQDPINIPEFNLLLANWGIVATSKADSEPPII